MSFSKENPWIKQREPIMCTWNALQNRGTFSNMQVSQKNDLMMFSNDQIVKYVKMLKAFGFTGMQITDGCFTWRPYASYKYVHDQIRRYAEALHNEDMHFTYWVWASCFSDYSWNDDTARYASRDGGLAYDDPEVYATFDKYYDIYSELADVTDMLIMHFADPGNLTNNEDIFAFARLLEKKFLAKNPNVKFGIETWGSADDFPDKLAAAGFKDHMLLELPFLPVWRAEGKRARFRQDVLNAGCRLGSWGWYTTDMEIDQFAAFHVNNRVLADVYRETREQGDSVAVPEYWSELSAYNVLNFASVYATAQLLIDPERSPDDMLREVTYMFYGEKYGAEVLRALELVRDARSGDTWDSYWWGDDTKCDIGTKDPADILERATKCYAEIEKISKDRTSYASLELPVEPYEILELMLPHIEQIRLYAEFRLDMAELEKKLSDGADKETLYRELDRIWHPIPDFNTIIGVWGQLEANYQDKAVYDFCVRAGIDVPKKGYRDLLIKRRFTDFMLYRQRADKERQEFAPDFYAGPFAYAKDAVRILDILCDEGVTVKNSNGTYSLANYEDFRYNFN